MAKRNTTVNTDRSNIYDKIFKELYRNLAPYVTSLGNEPFDRLEEVKLDLQYTLGKEADLLQKVYVNGKLDRMLHVEFQSAPDQAMQSRMLIYYGLLYERYQVPVDQYVIYVGQQKMHMETAIIHPRLQHHYVLRNISQEPASRFLKSPHSALVLLAILANYEGRSQEEIIRAILLRINELETDELVLSKRRTQLEVLAKLRNLQSDVLEIAKQMPIVLDYRTDIRYMEGQAEGEAKGKAKGKAEGEAITVAITRGLLAKQPTAQIAQEHGVTEEKVLMIKNSLGL